MLCLSQEPERGCTQPLTPYPDNGATGKTSMIVAEFKAVIGQHTCRLASWKASKNLPLCRASTSCREVCSAPLKALPTCRICCVHSITCTMCNNTFVYTFPLLDHRMSPYVTGQVLPHLQLHTRAKLHNFTSFRMKSRCCISHRMVPPSAHNRCLQQCICIIQKDWWPRCPQTV